MARSLLFSFTNATRNQGTDLSRLTNALKSPGSWKAWTPSQGLFLQSSLMPKHSSSTLERKRKRKVDGRAQGKAEKIAREAVRNQLSASSSTGAISNRFPAHLLSCTRARCYFLFFLRAGTTLDSLGVSNRPWLPRFLSLRLAVTSQH